MELCLVVFVLLYETSVCISMVVRMFWNYLKWINLITLIPIQGDVIVSFDDVRVGCEGTVPFRSTERIAFRYLISQK